MNGVRFRSRNQIIEETCDMRSMVWFESLRETHEWRTWFYLIPIRTMFDRIYTNLTKTFNLNDLQQLCFKIYEVSLVSTLYSNWIWTTINIWFWYRIWWNKSGTVWICLGFKSNSVSNDNRNFDFRNQLLWIWIKVWKFWICRTPLPVRLQWPETTEGLLETQNKVFYLIYHCYKRHGWIEEYRLYACATNYLREHKWTYRCCFAGCVRESWIGSAARRALYMHHTHHA